MKVRIIRAHCCNGRDVYDGDIVEMDDRLARIRVEMGWVAPASGEEARGETPKSGAGNEETRSNPAGNTPAGPSAKPKPTKPAKAGGKK